MRIHRLILILVVLILPVVTTMGPIQRSLTGTESGTVAAQKAINANDIEAEVKQEDGLSSIVAAETTAQTDVDLYLDADEVERRAAAEQSGDTTATSPSAVPVSFKHVPIPLPGGIDHAVAGVATRNSGQGVIRLRGIPPGSTLLSAILVWGEIAAPPALNPYNVNFGVDCTAGANVGGTPV
ncbi:MAG TPA: hypothetical protein VFY61_16485, partial [Pyrinomonadaceae bacterium]|nr:hypothetical protein [Pyrinomonadaceae bacterium]